MYCPERSKGIGDYAVLKVMIFLMDHGFVVLEPRADNSRYDVATEEHGKLCRIQVKSRRLKNGVIKLEVTSSAYKRKKHYTPEEIDYIALYCPDNNQTYWLPMKEIAGKKQVWLRVDCKGIRMTKTVRLACNYGVDKLREWWSDVSKEGQEEGK